MKKIKLMLVAFMAMVGVSAFADATPWATTTYKYTVDGTTVTITGFVTGYATDQMATVEIPNTLPNPADETKTVEVTAIESKAFEKNANIKKVVIKATKLAGLNDAFSGCANLAEIDFTAATGLKTISAGALTGTKLAKLDLSKTIVETIPALFGTTFDVTEAKDAVYWTEADSQGSPSAIDTHNAALTDKASIVKAAAQVTVAQANRYNATLKGAVKTTDKVTDAAFVETFNKTLTLVEAGQDVDATLATALNALTGISKVYNDGDVLKKADAELYNTNQGAIKVNGNYSEQAVVYYNGKLEGAIVGSDTPSDDAWNFILTGEPKAKEILAQTWNIACVEGFAYVGGVKEKAVEGKDAVAYATLTEVVLPETWTTIQTKAFMNCPNLATINFGKAKATQTIETLAFLGTGLTALDFTDSKVNVLPAKLLIDGDKVKKNETLKSVTLLKTFSDLKNNFANCTALTAIDLTYVTTLNAGEFAGSGLTTIDIPSAFSTIPAGTFENCAALTKVTFNHDKATFTSIGERAFAGCAALTSFTVPSVMPYDVANTATKGVYDNAFADCSSLTSFTYKPTIGSNAVKKVVSDNAFLGCNDGITFYTVKEYAEAQKVSGTIVAPMHTTFSYESNPDSEGSTDAKELTAKQFKQTGKTGMYFCKYQDTKANIKIAKADAKVYAAYNDDTDGSIIMQAFKPVGGYYHIAGGDNVLILSTKAKIAYETSAAVAGKVTVTTWTDADKTTIATAGDGSSWLASAAKGVGVAENMLKYVSDENGEKRSAIEAKLTGDFAGFSIYAWANTEAFTGWKKITSGTTFPQNTLYIFAKPAADGVRVIWLDENGNIEDETTAIQGIESVEEAGNGASYNLAGQKVNAAYKGVVIKDGKKYMMK